MGLAVLLMLRKCRGKTRQFFASTSSVTYGLLGAFPGSAPHKRQGCPGDTPRIPRKSLLDGHHG